MSARFVNVDRDTPMLFPPSLQEWVDANDMVHFVIESVDAMELPELKVNRRGSGHAQYPPRMMLALLIYCYAHGIMSSRKIERATWRDIPVRFLTGDTPTTIRSTCLAKRIGI
jgi:transposase